MHNTIKVEQHEGVTVLRLYNGVTNAIGMTLLEDLNAALDGLAQGGLVLAGNPKFFSMGFDLPQLLKLDRARMSEFFETFNQLVFRLLTLPLPTVCAMAGHAVAGGNILALACDYRFAAAGKKIGLNEARLGVPVPYLADLMLTQTVGGPAAKRMLYEGTIMAAEEARQDGLIDAICTPASLEQQAMQKAHDLAGLPGAALAAIKDNRVEHIRLCYEKYARQKNAIFLDCWFSDRAQDLLREAAKKF